jgi:hypothetical protein
MKYLTPFGTGNTANLDSLRSARSSIASGGKWGSHIEIFSHRPPSFDDTFVRLSDSGSVERWLAANPDGSELRVVPPESSKPVSRMVASGAIVLCTPCAGSWRVSIPRNDCFSTIPSDLDHEARV